MCYHNTLKKKPKEVAEYYEASIEDDLFDEIYHGNGFTFPSWPTLSQLENKTIKMRHWGLVPSWIKGKDEMKKIRTSTLNATCENVFEKASFKSSIHTNRCLVPSTGFIEWREVNKIKYPYVVSIKDVSIFSMAGISESWIDKDSGEIVETFSILTTEANEVMQMIHNTKKRMPALLKKSDEKKWLDSSITKEDIQQLCIPFANEEMEYYTIGPKISSRNYNTNVKEISTPYNYPELNMLF
jgi:putative SOS response-associated peptidase YedK